MKHIIVANGEFKHDIHMKKMIEAADVVICADGGARHLILMKMLPDVVIGDLDSLAGTDLDWLRKNDVDIIKYPRRKDAGDTELAVSWAIENGATDITLTGVTGTRMDHSLANLFLLKMISDKGITCRILNAQNEVYLVDDKFTIAGEPGELLSIIPITERVTGLTLSGLEYPLKNAVLSMGTSMGISNVFAEKEARISLENGIVIVTKSRD